MSSRRSHQNRAPLDAASLITKMLIGTERGRKISRTATATDAYASSNVIAARPRVERFRSCRSTNSRIETISATRLSVITNASISSRFTEEADALGHSGVVIACRHRIEPPLREPIHCESCFTSLEVSSRYRRQSEVNNVECLTARDKRNVRPLLALVTGRCWAHSNEACLA